MEFAILKELVQTITRNRVKHIAVLGNPGQEDKLTEQLYDLISKGKLKSDAEAVGLFFNSKKVDHYKYRRLKQRLMKQLVNSVFFLDSDKAQYNERSRAYYHCYRDFAAANILFMQKVDKPAALILSQVLENATKYEFFDIKAEAARQLYKINIDATLNFKKYYHFIKLSRKFEFQRYWLLTAQSYIDRIGILQLQQKYSNKKIYQKANGYYEKLSSKVKKVDNDHFTVATQIILLMTLAIKCNHLAIVQSAKAIIDIANINPNIHRGYLRSAEIHLIVANIQLQEKNWEEINFLIIRNLQNPQHSAFNQGVLICCLFTANTYNKKYSDCLDFVQYVTSSKNEIFKSQINVEIWSLILSYIHLLATLDKIDKEQVVTTLGPFRIHKFLNSFPILEKEKRARNIPIILLPLLLALAEGKTDYHGRSLEALDKYRQRHLEDEHNRRSSIFMRLLFAIVERLEKPDDTSAADKKIEKEVEALYALPMKDVPQPYMVEIIPYEHLWEMLRVRLKL